MEYELESGRIITDEEVTTKDKVAVVRYTIKEEFFPNTNATGKYITAFGVPVKIIGVLKRK